MSENDDPMSSATSTRPAKPAPGNTPALGVATVKLTLLGPAGAGKRSLLAAMPGELAMPFSVADSLQPVDGLLLVCEADQSAGAQEAALEPWLAELQRHIEKRGNCCEVGGLPLYLVLTKADRLALPSDSHASWLERIEGAKQSAGAWLENRLPKLAEGFGGVALHVWATALRRPQGHSGAEQRPFGVHELAKHALDAARRYQVHKTLQRRRTRAVIGLVLLVLVGMLVSIVYWALRHGGLFDRSRIARYEADRLRLDQVAEARKLLEQSARLLSFGDYRSADGATDWTRWRADAETVQERLFEATSRDLAGPDLALSPQGMELARAARAIDQVRIRAELLGLGGESGNDRSALLRGPESGTTYATLRESTEEAYRRLATHYRTFRPAPLPAEAPLGVVHELQSAAQSSIDRLCEPVRCEIRQRMLQLGGGKETAEAWLQLRDGWLRKDADKELKAWRDLVALLQVLEGCSQPSDPVQELRKFLSTPSFVLALDGVELQFPVVFELGQHGKLPIRRVLEPMEVRRQRNDQTEVIQLQVERERWPDRWLFRSADTGKPVRLELQRGDEVWARVRLEDVNHQTWLLTWSPADSSSRVFSFETLSRAPRLHPEDQPDPARGAVAHGAILRFDGAEALRLPLLFPR